MVILTGKIGVIANNCYTIQIEIYVNSPVIALSTYPKTGSSPSLPLVIPSRVPEN